MLRHKVVVEVPVTLRMNVYVEGPDGDEMYFDKVEREVDSVIDGVLSRLEVLNLRPVLGDFDVVDSTAIEIPSSDGHGQ